MTSVDQPGVVARILGWLGAGYPQGIPRTDRFPLIAVLKRRLTDDEVRQIAARLSSDGDLVDAPITEQEIESLIQQVTVDDPDEADVARVSARLAAGGWPLAGPDES